MAKKKDTIEEESKEPLEAEVEEVEEVEEEAAEEAVEEPAEPEESIETLRVALHEERERTEELTDRWKRSAATMRACSLRPGSARRG